jgi:hypothetical protein
MRAELIFVGQRRSQVSDCLRLTTYDTDEAQPTIVLPVANALSEALPGAPSALLNADGIDVIDDTSKITYRQAVSTQIKNEITEYFRESPFRSFGSIRIIASRGTAIGVVNVDARATHVFGDSAEEHRRIAEYLIPFCTTLGIVFSIP